jgi:hypothetical protein
MTQNKCTEIPELMQVQIPALHQAIERNRYYLGELSKHYINRSKAETDFSEKHLQYWGEIFKALFCTYKCHKKDKCKTSKRYHGIAKMFHSEVDEFGIDAILEGGNETEAIFTKFRDLTST